MRVSRSLAVPPSRVLGASALVFATALAWGLLAPQPAEARSTQRELPASCSGQPAEVGLPAHRPGEVRADTVSFGYYTTISGESYAVVGETWTFDHGAPDPLEGWQSIDVTGQPSPRFRTISGATWSGHENAVVAPIPTGAGAAWVGTFQDEADDLCWESGLGYGNRWVQEWRSPTLHYTGSGAVNLSFRYFSDAEEDYDYARVRIEFDPLHSVGLNGDGFTGVIGNPGTSSYPTFATTIPQATFQGFTAFSLVFEFTSDGGWSDEDGGFDSSYGPFGADDVAFSGSLVEGSVSYGFEGGDEGWTAAVGSAEGPEFGVADFSGYGIPILCGCDVGGLVAELHAPTLDHPDGQYERILSPIVDRGALGSQYNQVLAEWDQISLGPTATGVFYRPRWMYYPYNCPLGGGPRWSEPMGTEIWGVMPESAQCERLRNVATDWGVPADAELYRFVLEVVSDCTGFVPPEECTHGDTPAPLFDNLQVRVTSAQQGPKIAFEAGTFFADGFPFSQVLSATSVGNADIVFDLHRDLPVPDRLGDSLVIKGPPATPSTRWEAKLWWRVRREGPGQAGVSSYNPWKTAVSDGRNIVGPSGQFTFGIMDSVQTGVVASRNKFISEFREDDDDFAGENAHNNEMIRDLMLTPGTQIEYFVTSRYVTGTEEFYLPDTTGKNLLSFEILPSIRQVSGVNRYPCLLYIDANDREGMAPQRRLEHALNSVLGGAGPSDPIPNPAVWDRWDVEAACSCFNAPLLRSPGGNNGVSLTLLLSYRTIFLDVGGGESALEAGDATLFSDWLSFSWCDGNLNRQGFIGTGEGLVRNLAEVAPQFLNNDLGAIEVCSSIPGDVDPSCGPSPELATSCVRIEDASGAPFPSFNGVEGDYQLELLRNPCVEERATSVLAPLSGGIGNRIYFQQDEVPPTGLPYSQIVHSVLGVGSNNYRTVLDAVSWAHLSARDATDECVADDAHVVAGAANELRTALTWIYGSLPGNLCPVQCPVGVFDPPLTTSVRGSYLQSVQPNPFHEGTAIRYSLASNSAVELVVYDAAGRRVRQLVHSTQSAGPHELVWDGADDAGRPLSSGIFWAQLRTDDYTSNRKLIRLE